MGDHGQAVGGGFEVDKAEAFHAMTVVDARHGEDVGAFVHSGEFVVGNVAKKTHSEVWSLGGGGAERFLVAFFALAADDPIFYPGSICGGEELKGFEGEELALTRVESE